MKVLLLFFLTSLQASIVTYGQNITLTLKNTTVEKALSEISKQAGIDLAYDSGLFKKMNPINVNVKNVTVNQALTAVIDHDLFEYELKKNTLVVRDKATKRTVAAENTPMGKQQSVRGRVTDEAGKGLGNVTVKIKGKPTTTTTDGQGNYSFSKLAGGDILVFSILGYQSQEVNPRDRAEVNIVMKEETSGLDEVVVTGYQTISKKLFTGSSTNVKMSDIKLDGVTDVSRMLEGRVGGVSVQNVSGTFGAAPKIRVRGATSITGDNKPLWVVDGVVLEDIISVSNDELSSGDPMTLIGSSVAGINADDIESFDILKDASATALYGARAMNGVVVIKTKKGRIGKPTVSYTGNFATSFKPTYGSFNIMNSKDQMSIYLEMDRKNLATFAGSLRSANGGVFTKMYQLIDTYDKTSGEFGLPNNQDAKAAFLKRYAVANTNWFDELFQNSLAQDHSISISSGTDNAQHYFSGSFFNDNGWTIADKVRRYTVNVRSDYKFSEKLSAGFIVNGSIRDQHAPGTQGRLDNAVFGEVSRDFDINPYSYALNTSRTLTAYQEDGQLEYFTKNYAPFNIINELAENRMIINVMDLKTQLELGYKFNKKFDYKVLGSLRYVRNNRQHQATEYSNMANSYRADGNNSVIRSSNRYLYNNPDYPEEERQIVLPEGGFMIDNQDFLKTFYARHTLTYQDSWNEDKHKLNVFVGQEIRYADRENSYSNGYGYQYYKGGVAFTDYRIIKQSIENNYSYFGARYNYERFSAFFGNANYGYKNRYVVNVTGRVDGANKMGKSRTARYLPTWTVSGAWNVDEEEFLKRISEISFLKIRAAYGLTGSTGNATNSAVVYTNTSTKRPYLSDTETKIQITSLQNKELTWEKQHEANFGFDMGLLNNRYSLTFDYYLRKSFDLINTVRTSGIGGQVTKTANYADMESQGFEFNLGFKFVQTEDFSYRSNITFGYNKNKILNLKNTPRIWDLVKPEGGPIEGGAVRGLYSVEFAGLDHLNGVPRFVNSSGQISHLVDLQTSAIKYLKYEGTIDPTINGGFNSSFRYKDLSLNIFFTYQLGNKIRLDPAFKASYTDLDAMPNDFNNRWIMPGDELLTFVPSIMDPQTRLEMKSTYPYSYYNYSDVRVVDGSFVRLKNITLNYAIPQRYLKSMGLKGGSIACSANNLALFFADEKLMGQDPEFFNSGGVALPMPKQISLTLRLSL